MSDIRVCKVQNKLDLSNLEDLVVCSIWAEAKLKVYIVKNNSMIFFGEEAQEQLQKFAKTFSKTLEAYLEEAKEIFCGLKDDIDFSLTDCKFSWKRKKWPVGHVQVKQLQDVESITSLVLVLMNEYSRNKILLGEIQKDHQSAKLSHSEIMKKLNECISLKEQLEDGLYKKFALILNSKKAKIKALKDQLKKLEEKSIFTDSTDESESELEEKNNKSCHSNKKRAHGKNKYKNPSYKRKKGSRGNDDLEKIEKNHSNNDGIVCKSIESIPSTSGITKKANGDDNIQIIENNYLENNELVSSSKSAEPTPSTNSDTQVINQDDKETPDLLSGESECDLELKFDEDKVEDKTIKGSAIMEEDSQEEMF